MMHCGMEGMIDVSVVSGNKPKLTTVTLVILPDGTLLRTVS